MADTATTNTLVATTIGVKPSIVRFNVDQQCPIQYVTVYNDRAEVTRSLQHHFDAEGTYDLVLDGFSTFVDETSLHVSGGTSKSCTILEVSYQTRYEDVALPSDSTPLDNVQSQLENVQTGIKMHKRELARLEKQRLWLDGRSAKLMNQDGPCTANDLDNMQKFLEFYRKMLLKLDDETVREEDEVKKLNDRENALKAQINQHGAEAQANRRKTCREVTITVHIASAQKDMTLEISYLISNCSWSASYDVRVNSVDANRQRTQLTYYGIIVNKSQENWHDASFSLSTATPSLGGTPPKLNTLKIDYCKPPVTYHRQRSLSETNRLECYDAVAEQEMAIRPQMKRLKGAFRSFRGKSSLAYDPTIEDTDEESAETTVNVLASKTETSMSSTSFVIPRRSTIDSDGKPHKVTIGVLDLTSTFTYTVVPKMSLHAYLKASTVNTSDKQLLTGPASIFMDNNFVTHSSIDNVCIGDTFDLPLGTDASVKVEYKPVKKMTDTQGLISKVHHETIRHETHIVNTKSTEITVFVYEQVPLSSNEKIKVKLLSPELRQKDNAHNCTVTMNDRNNLEWKCILPAHGEYRFPLEYMLEWPKEKRVEFKEE
ncbi:unnamed protein product [Rotaria sp. Silwood1]|nr:unnamed protein product [Rotaria sp. Silwood1]CAF1393350.1 unnamed protein product [Rotaria sp. Silwood1]CAF3544034.1 unnamed protein product [Rotaria sp. Silwood1]CAF3631399.1 unnamed protein product [Rotaria sp. Silwood1]CAF4968869.1 unnamed protein product [Rotaria sp. Silwood1]